MAEEQHCRECGMAGCTSRRTEEIEKEEIGAAPYLVVAAILIIGVSLAIRWLM